MTGPHPGTPDAFVRLRASGWIISLCLHGTAVFLAGLFAAKISLAPPSSSFHWDVTVIGSQSPAAPTQVAPGAQTSAAAVIRPAQRSAPATALRPTPSQAAPPTIPAITTSSLSADNHHKVAPTLTPPIQEPQPLREPTRTVPLSEPDVSQTESQPALHATLPPAETLSPTQTAPSPATETPLSSESSTVEQAAASSHTASLAPSSSMPQAIRKPDYGWLAVPLLQRIEALKRYPATARLQRLEGRVVVRIIVQEDGHIASATIANSSGHEVLDQAALETIRQASPLTLSQPLEKSSVTMQIPLGYYLDR